MRNFFHQFCRRFFSDNVYGGMLIIFATAASAATNGTTHSFSADVPPMEILFFKCFFGLLLLLSIYRRQFFGFFKTHIVPIHAAKGLCGALGNWAWISAVQHLPLAESSALSMTSAFFTSLGGMWFFKERFLPKVWFAITVGFVGVLLIVQPNQPLFNCYIFYPLVSAFFFSISSLLIKRLSREDSSQTTLQYLLGFMGVFAFLSQVYIPWVLPEIVDLVKFFIIGTSYVLTQVCLIEAYTYAYTSFLAPFKYARFPLNILTGLAFFAEVPVFTTILGGVVILLSYAWLIRLEYKVRRSKT